MLGSVLASYVPPLRALFLMGLAAAVACIYGTSAACVRATMLSVPTHVRPFAIALQAR